MHPSIARRSAVLLGATAVVLAACAAPAASPADVSPTADPTPTTAETTAAATETASPEPTEAGSEEAEVILGMSSFSPGELRIPAGTEVTFSNDSGLPHTITHGTNGRPVDDPAFDRTISDGATVTIAFDEPGTFDVTCKIHPEMQMTIIVEG